MATININIEATNPGEVREALLELLGGNLANDTVALEASTRALSEASAAAVAIVNKEAAESAKDIISKPEAPKAAPKTPKTKAAEPKPEPPAAPPEAPAPAENTEVSYVEVRERLTALARLNKQTEIMAALKTFGITKLSEAKPEQYGPILEAMAAL